MKLHPIYILLGLLVLAGIFGVVYYELRLSPNSVTATLPEQPTYTPTSQPAALQPGVTRTPRIRNTPTPKPTQTPPVIPPPPEPGRMNLMVLITFLVILVILIGLAINARLFRENH